MVGHAALDFTPPWACWAASASPWFSACCRNLSKLSSQINPVKPYLLNVLLSLWSPSTIGLISKIFWYISQSTIWFCLSSLERRFLWIWLCLRMARKKRVSVVVLCFLDLHWRAPKSARQRLYGVDLYRVNNKAFFGDVEEEEESMKAFAILSNSWSSCSSPKSSPSKQPLIGSSNFDSIFGVSFLTSPFLKKKKTHLKKKKEGDLFLINLIVKK